MTGKIGLFLCLITLALNALADERRLEQRLDDLERRVMQLEAQLDGRGGGSSVNTLSGFSGRFSDATARRSISLKMDGTFSLQNPAGSFSGAWQKTGDQVLIRGPAGFTETFRVTGDVLVDSQGRRWTKTP